MDKEDRALIGMTLTGILLFLIGILTGKALSAQPIIHTNPHKQERTVSMVTKSGKDYAKNRKHNIVVMGEAKIGKTLFTSTAPGKLYYFLFDYDGIESIAGFNSEAMERLDYDEFYPGTGEFNDMMQPWNNAERKMADLTRECPYDVVVLDSLTSMQDTLWSWCLGKMQIKLGDLERIGKGKGGQLDHYSHLGSRGQAFVTNFLKLPCHRIITAHDQWDKDELTGVLKYKVAGRGKMLPDWFSTFKDFSCLFKMERVNVGGNKSYKVRTNGGTGLNCGTRWQGLSDLEDPNLYAMMKKAGVNGTEAKNV